MPFEFDPAKSAARKAKHGIDFEEAQALWGDGDAFAIPSRYASEERFLVIGEIKGSIWTAIVAHRGGNTRLISVRRARKNETEAYHRRRTRQAVR
jgi:uncharacterized DUF497 family protein